MNGDLGATANRGSILLLLEDSEFLRCIQGEAVKIIKNLLPCFFIIQFVFTTFPDIFWIQYHIVGNLQYGSPSCPLSTLHGERIVGVEQGPHLSSESQSYTSKRMSVIMTSNDVQTFATTYKVGRTPSKKLRLSTHFLQMRQRCDRGNLHFISMCCHHFWR